jgi:hypothetical protein
MGEKPAASLRVIVVPRDREKRHILHMDRAVFLSLFNDLGLDDYALYLYLTTGMQAVNVILLGDADARWTTNGLVQAMWVKQRIIFNPLYLVFVACFQGFLGI